MKNHLSTFTLSVFMAGAVLTSCQSNAKKVENAEKSLEEAKLELSQTQRDSIADFEKFKKESEENIAAHEKSIAEFKERLKSEKKENRAEYEKKLAELEQKNGDMKKKLDDYKAEGNDKWAQFKVEFKHDMEEFGKAFKNLTVKNTK